MSKRDDLKNDNQEPWEQPIYDTEGEDLGSRTQRRSNKNGNKVFLISLVVLLVLCIGLIMGFWMIVTRDTDRAAVSESTTETTTAISSTKESSTKESSTKESSSESSTVESSSSSSETVPSSSETEPSSSEETPAADDAMQQADGTNNGTTNNDTTNNATTNGDTTNNGTTNDQTTQNANTEGDYTLVRDGEGPNQVAARTGVSVDTLFQLNGLDPNNYMLYPGQQLRIR
ncbi:LysM peptidoglycan-binding domain-containing protein [Enterococcus asini]|uniref:SAG1386/EF1546 family surface-associated protein n=1 Tax=Enterococcus asini TaxID=57732 RepID=UPI001E452540|nr:SAG1386/EF1546 family surface-associated protein [Enterococcus asini]MCD5028976.1 LysM peptidoglycan-binding domain-containing protein [Enterococcus asini]MDT2783994.1 LysM peptidoglycan-binding domain-containing protein [Enterococcus asini]